MCVRVRECVRVCVCVCVCVYVCARSKILRLHFLMATASLLAGLVAGIATLAQHLFRIRVELYFVVFLCRLGVASLPPMRWVGSRVLAHNWRDFVAYAMVWEILLQRAAGIAPAANVRSNGSSLRMRSRSRTGDHIVGV